MKVSKVSDITVESVADYLRLDEVTESEINTLTTLISVAISFIKSYTGLDDISVDKYPEFVIVVVIFVRTCGITELCMLTVKPEQHGAEHSRNAQCQSVVRCEPC